MVLRLMGWPCLGQVEVDAVGQLGFRQLVDNPPHR